MTDDNNTTHSAQGTATIRNGDGIHCRPSVVIIKELETYGGEVTVANEMGSTNLRSVMSLLTLGLREGDSVCIDVQGDDAPAVLQRIIELFETHFDFPPREDNASPQA